MMLSILVCHSYYLRLDRKQLERSKPYPPLATLQVAAMLRKAGHRVSFFDAMLAEGPEDYATALTAAQPQVVLLYEDTFNFLSKMCLAQMRQAACEMIALAHRAGIKVIAAGPDVTDAPDVYLGSGADLALLGEGLSSLFEFLPRLDAQPAAPTADLVEGLTGIASSLSGRTVAVNGARLVPAGHYDGLAAWDLVDIRRYRSMWRKAHGYFSLNMAASRGCSFRCAWCAKPTWGNHYLQRSATDVAAEMAYLKRTFAPDHIWFADDIFGFRVDWVQDFAAATRGTEEGLPFTIQTRADLISERMAEALAAAGCREAWLGAESGSQRVLDAMNKGTTVEEILIARERLGSAGIRVGFFIQLGYLGEDLADILATRALLDEAQPDEIGVSVSYPLPGTKFHETVKAQLGAKTHWRESDDLDMMFEGTYTSEFYRAVRDLLHEQVGLRTVQFPHKSGERRRAERSLEAKWHELLSREDRYRSGRRQTDASLAVTDRAQP
jgi:anaerobic magnesium-protoporphyrin IX monomethyl ester cyclase